MSLLVEVRLVHVDYDEVETMTEAEFIRYFTPRTRRKAARAARLAERWKALRPVLYELRDGEIGPRNSGGKGFRVLRLPN